MPDLQSAYRANHSTETAVLRVLSDILDALNRSDFTVLTLLDISAAFDMVDCATLLRHLQTTHGITGTALVWFSSYLHERKISVHYRGTSSTPSSLLCEVKQGSVLGPILFLLHTADLLGFNEDMLLHPHLYSDDTQICGFCVSAEVSDLQQRFSTYVNRVSKWMQANCLQLNAAKTELLWCAPPKQQDRLPNVALRISSYSVQLVTYVPELGIYIDRDVSMRTHITRIVSNCFSALRQLQSIRRSVSQPVLLSLVMSLILT